MKIRHFWFSAQRLPFNALFIRYFGHSGAIDNHHKDGRITICNNALLTEGNWRTNRDFGVFKNPPRFEWTKFWKFDCHFWSSKSNATFSIFCCNLFPFVETFLLNKGKFWCYNQNLWPRSEVYSDELESSYRSKTNIYWKKGLKVYWPSFHNAINFWWMTYSWIYSYCMTLHQKKKQN